jgi:hypothetical protein
MSKNNAGWDSLCVSCLIQQRVAPKNHWVAQHSTPPPAPGSGFVEAGGHEADGDSRKGGISRDDPKPKWPHHVDAGPREQRGDILRCRCPVGDAAHVLSAPR